MNERINESSPACKHFRRSERRYKRIAVYVYCECSEARHSTYVGLSEYLFV